MLFTKHSENVTVLETALFAIVWRRAFWFRGVSRQVVPAATKSQRSRGEGVPAKDLGLDSALLQLGHQVTEESHPGPTPKEEKR